jgi:hypothetical protein
MLAHEEQQLQQKKIVQ